MRIPSPFNYPEIAEFSVPKMASDPREFDAHSDEVFADVKLEIDPAELQVIPTA